MTAQTFADAVTEIALVVNGVNGVFTAPPYPQENINERVFALTYLMSSVTEISEIGTKMHLATIAIDLLTPLMVLSEAIENLLPIADAVTTALVTEASSGGDMFSGAVDTYANLRVEFLPSYIYQNTPMIGYRVMLEDVKLRLDL